MSLNEISPIRKLVLVLCCALTLIAPVTSRLGRTRADNSADPWTGAQTVEPADFAKELAAANGRDKATVVCVGFHALFAGAHIPGASFHGSASTAQGIESLKDWARELPRSANIVLYCGCCPLAHCPNIRPAFVALRDMGFTHLRALILPNDLNTDWIAKGYPVEKAK